ncbi:hypothetical protein ATO1_24570 [Phaeobacter sp. 22II1-1F12B]|nr:hypothetical protein ATO1_24570 [Phaeobacter sp. 22II1-1F12B]
MSRHAIQRWIERGGAGDPRIELLKKLDSAASHAFFKMEISRVALEIQTIGVRDADGAPARFGVPDRVGGMWVAGLAGFSKPMANRHTARGVFLKGLCSFLTYLESEQMSPAQMEYRNVALTRGIVVAAEMAPDIFRPRRTE